MSALAKGLAKSESEIPAASGKAEKAHRAAHEARESAMYAAVAKALGKDVADVKAAFEAARGISPAVRRIASRTSSSVCRSCPRCWRSSPATSCAP